MGEKIILVPKEQQFIKQLKKLIECKDEID